jgi:hypothetical protein
MKVERPSAPDIKKKVKIGMNGLGEGQRATLKTLNRK